MVNEKLASVVWFLLLLEATAGLALSWTGDEIGRREEEGKHLPRPWQKHRTIIEACV